MSKISDDKYQEIVKEERIFKRYRRILEIIYAIILSHIFLLPNDILTKFSFLVPYVEFMKEKFAMIYQISIRIPSIKEAGTLWACNMMVVTIVFIFLFAYVGLKDPVMAVGVDTNTKFIEV